MDIFELREMIEELRYNRNYDSAKSLLKNLNDEASTLCDRIEVSLIR